MHQAATRTATVHTLFQPVYSRGSLLPLGMTSRTQQPSSVEDCFKNHFSTEVYKITIRSVFLQIYKYKYIDFSQNLLS